MRNTRMALLFSLALLALSARAEETEGKNVIYKYKQYESIDLGGLEVKGNIIAPGDISVKERDRKEFGRDLLERPNFDKEVIEDIHNLR